MAEIIEWPKLDIYNVSLSKLDRITIHALNLIDEVGTIPMNNSLLVHDGINGFDFNIGFDKNYIYASEILDKLEILATPRERQWYNNFGWHIDEG